MPLRRATAVVTILAALLAPAAARADGDPASDVLLLQDVFLPYFPAPSKPLAKSLEGLLAAARKAGYPMKVALIQSPGDLGAYPELFGKPDKYAKLLESEIVFKVKRPNLLVVMPSGLAGRNLGPRATQALPGIAVDKAQKSDGLVTAAIAAVEAVAKLNGHPVRAPAVAGETQPEAHDSGSRDTLVYVVAVVIVLLGIALIAVSVRTRRSGEDVGGERGDDNGDAGGGEQGDERE